jgi:hypothetical protein
MKPFNFQEAELKISTAEKLCTNVQNAFSAARASLSERVSVNGYGIYQNRFEIRAKLKDAQYYIETALKTLEEIDWPTNTDYDQM